MFSATLTRFLGNGPFYPNDGFEKNSCKNNWWYNLLYVNNFNDFINSVRNFKKFDTILKFKHFDSVFLFLGT